VAVTPVLDSLISAQGTVYCLNMSPQVDKGMSSDGQLLYNLGTLPPYSGALLYNQAKGKRLPSLAAQLRATHATAAIFGEDGRTWDKKHVFECYGYRHVLTSDDSRLHTPFDSIGADMATALYACMIADTLRQPFFIQILSVSSHFPFDKPAGCTDDLPADPSLSNTENNYLRNIHYLDQSIGALIDGLRKRGILDNTIIVVASDHHMNMNGSLAPNRPIAFIAANCGRTQRVDRADQADVFPTLCAMLGLKRPWRGVGRDMLDTESGYSDNGRSRRSLSDSLLRSDYFK
ncbi:MAG: LTA synthase family protein, partial [Muribaculaceae bacterium]|nr:LTA synthase family protein [Muribaculaceae bacterium]